MNRYINFDVVIRLKNTQLYLFILFLVFNLYNCRLNAQNEHVITLMVNVKDSFTKYGVSGAKYVIMKFDGTVVDSGIVSEGYGNKSPRFIMLQYPRQKDSLKVYVTHPDYNAVTIRWNINPKGRLQEYNFDDILMKKLSMSERNHELKGIVVKSTKIKMAIHGDTLIYDADAFKVPEGSMLDGLIRQMPGVELKDNGEIFVNGKKIEELTLNDKDFFRHDSKTILENLPYYMVKNVEVYYRENEISRRLGQDIGQKDYVMNVRLKPEYNQGFISNVDVAKGTHDRYLGRIFGLRFTDNSRFTLFSNLNNVNESRNPGNNGNWSPSNNTMGLTALKTIGADLLIDNRKGTFKDNMNGTISWKDAEDESREATENFLNKDNSYNCSTAYSRHQSRAFSVSNKLNLHLPLDIEITNDLKQNHQSQTSLTRSATFTENPFFIGNVLTVLDSVFHHPSQYYTAINRTLDNGMGYGDSFSTSHSVSSFNPLPWGDYFGVDANFIYKQSDQHDFNLYSLDYLKTSESNLQNKYGYAKNRSYDINTSFYYIIRFLSGLRMNINYTYGESSSHDENSHYRLDSLAGYSSSVGILPSTTDSLLLALDKGNSYRRNYLSKDHSVAVTFDYEKVNTKKGDYTILSLGIPIHLKEERNHYIRAAIDTIARHSSILFMPSFKAELTRNGNRHYDLHYNYMMQTPDMNLMVNIYDNTNPLAIRLGNPKLKNSGTHHLDANFYYEWPKSGRGLNLTQSIDVMQNLIGNAIMYNTSSGVYTFRPENINGNWTAKSNIEYHTYLDKSQLWVFSSRSIFIYNHNVDLVSTTSNKPERNNVKNYLTSEVIDLKYEKNKLRLNLTSDIKWDVSLQNASSIHALNYSYGINGQYLFPLKLEIASDIKMYSYRGYNNTAMNTNNLIWNISVSRPFFNGRFVSRIEAFDLLHQLSQTVSVVNGQGRTEIWQRSLPNYIMFHLAYKLNVNPHKR